VTNSFSFGGSYEIPRLASGGRWVNEAVSGWRISTITVAQSGTPFTVGNANNGAGSPDSMTGQTGVAVAASYAYDNGMVVDNTSGGTPKFPTYLGHQRKGFDRYQASHGSIFGQQYNNGAWSVPTFSDPQGTGLGPVLSQQGANSFRNLGYFNVNMGVAKAFGIPYLEGGKLTLRGDFINLLNRTNWGNFSNDIYTGGGSFGFAGGASNKRYVQLGARFEF
jgi:hypothetical protein